MIDDYDAAPAIVEVNGVGIEAEEPPLPLSQEEDDIFLRQAREWFRCDKEHSAEWRLEAKEDFDFVAGHQWSESDQTKLRDEMRPVITFNRIQPMVEAVTGIEIGNRREVKYIPREMGDANANEILTSAAEWSRDECDAEDEESDAFGDAVVCGMGWTETRIDYEEDPEGKIIVDRIDPIEMYWDSSARKRNLADARRRWRVRSMPISDAQALVPDALVSEMDASWARGEKDSHEPHVNDPDRFYDDDKEHRRIDDKKQVTLVHMQWWEREPFYRVAWKDQIHEVPEDRYPALQAAAQAEEMQAAMMGMPIPPLRAQRQFRHKYMQAIIGSKVLERGPAPCDAHFSWECMTGKRDHNNGTWYGLVRGIKDPQRWANKWLSQSLHILNTNAKGGWMAERGMFDDDREAEETLSRADRITWTKTGALQRGAIQPKTATGFPAGFDNLMSMALNAIKESSGINTEMLGMRDAAQAGVLEEQRKQAGMTILAAMFDSLRRYRKRQGRLLLYFITKYMSDGRLIRVVGEDGSQYVPLLKQPGLVKFDVIVDEAVNTANQKDQVWSTFQNILPMMGQMFGPEDILTMLEYSPFPSSIIEKLKRRRAEEAEDPAAQGEQQLQQQMAEADAQADIAKKESETAENQAQVQLLMAQVQKLQADMQKVLAETQAIPMQGQLGAQATMMKAQVDSRATMMRAQADVQAKMLRAQPPQVQPMMPGMPIIPLRPERIQ